MLRLLLIALILTGCGDAIRTSVPLETLVLQDSLYMEPESMQPYSGFVVKTFEDDPDQVQLRGELLEGMWEGEITVYHENGRVRYLGSLSNGVKCGEWIENRDADPPDDVLAELKQEIESMGIYPPCPER